MINTVVRQIAFYDFECKLHEARRAGELTPEDINALWMSVQAESLGPAFEFMEGYETFWAYIPHFRAFAVLRLRLRIRRWSRQRAIRRLS